MLPGLHVQHELRERPVQAGDAALHDGEARAGELDAQIEIQPERRADIDMVAHREFQAARRAPGPQHDVAVLVRTHRHAGMRQIGYGEQQRLQLGLDLLQPGRRSFQRALDAGHLGHHLIDLRLPCRPLGLQLPDLAAQRVAPVLELLGAGLDGLAFGFEGAEAFDVQERLR